MRRADVRKVYDGAAAALRSRGLQVRPPRLLRPDGGYTVGGLMFVFFAQHLGEVKTKGELVDFLRAMRCRTTDPQPRHLGAQAGFQFLVRGCYHPGERRVLRAGEYSLLDLSTVHPNHHTAHRTCTLTPAGFVGLKQRYAHRCAVCGSREGERHLKNAHLVTTLERGHRDPRRPLTPANCLPMCGLCNQVYMDHAVFNARGFVVDWLAAPKPPPRARPPGPRLQAEAGAGGKARAKAGVKEADGGGAPRTLVPPRTGPPPCVRVRVRAPVRALRVASPRLPGSCTGPVTRSRARAGLARTF